MQKHILHGVWHHGRHRVKQCPQTQPQRGACGAPLGTVERVVVEAVLGHVAVEGGELLCGEMKRRLCRPPLVIRQHSLELEQKD
jgi:hypothetical protein